MRHILLFVLFFTSSLALHSQCNNIDFESGLTGWTMETGCNPNVQPGTTAFDGTPNFACGGAWTPVTSATINTNTNTIQVITSNAATYQCTNFSRTSPLGGTKVLQMGGLSQWNGRAERVSQTVTITAANAIMSFAYAALLQGFNYRQDHGTLAGRPMFSIEVLDANNNVLPCAPGVKIYSGDDQPVIPSTQINSPVAPCWEIYHTNGWQTLNYDFSGYLGQTITIRFITMDCSAGGDIGMAFIDGKCTPITPTPVSSCSGSVNLTGPAGGSNYQWQPGGAATQNITATTAGQYTVTYTDAGGCKKGALYDVSFTGGATPLFNITPGSCSNPAVTVADASTGGPTAYSWSFGDGNTFNGQNPPAHTYGSNGTYTITLQVTDAGGCTSSLQKQVVVSAGNAAANFTAQPICLNNPTVFADNSGAVTTWNWDFGEGSSGANNTSTQQNPQHTYSAAGTYTVTLSVADANGCTGSTTSTVVINPLPQSDFTAPSVCINNQTVFKDESTITGGNIASWNWNFGDAATSTVQDPSHQYASSGTYTVMLTVTSNNGCQSNFSKTVDVVANPTSVFAAPSVCLTNATVFANTSTPANAQGYSWDFGDGTNSTDQSPSHTYTTTGTFVVSLTVTAGIGCTATSTQNAVVNPAAVPVFNTQPVCLNDQTLFTDGSTIANGTITGYDWDFGDGSQHSAAVGSTNYTYTTAGTYTATLQLTSSNGCKSQVSQQVVVNPLPAALFDNSPVCLNSSSAFADQSTVSSGNITTWDWDFGDGSAHDNNASPTHTYSTAGTYTTTLSITTNGGCTDTYDKQVIILPPPQVSFTAPDTDGCAPFCVTIEDQTVATAPDQVATWSWTLGDGSTSTTQNPQHCYNDPGTYSVDLSVVTAAGCKGSFSRPNWIVAYPTPTAQINISPRVTSIYDPIVTITDASLGSPTSWNWDLGDGTTSTDQNPGTHTYVVDENGAGFTVHLDIENQYHCTSSATDVVTINPDWSFYIPNSFTPNGDGTNDYFYGKGTGIKSYEMYIYDRWGNEIFACNTAGLPQSSVCQWDGKVQGGGSNSIAQIDVYVWLVKLNDVFDKKHTYIGHVSLIR